MGMFLALCLGMERALSLGPEEVAPLLTPDGELVVQKQSAE